MINLILLMIYYFFTKYIKSEILLCDKFNISKKLFVLNKLLNSFILLILL